MNLYGKKPQQTPTPQNKQIKISFHHGFEGGEEKYDKPAPRKEWALVLPYGIGKKNFIPAWSFSKMERHQMKAGVEILHWLAPPESISLMEVTENSNVCYELYE